MSGSEAVAILGILSSVIAIVDATRKVYDAASSAPDLPDAFREVAKRLPIVGEILGRAEQCIRNGSVNDTSCSAMKPLINACKERAKKLDMIFQKVLPEDDASRWERYVSAAKTLGKGGKVEILMKGLMDDVLLLASKHGMEAATTQQFDKLGTAIRDLSNLEPSIPDAALEETAFTNNNFGNGPMTNNNVMGNQSYQANYGTGKQFLAENQTFHMGSEPVSQQTYRAHSQQFISARTIPSALVNSEQVCEDGVLGELNFRGMDERYEGIEEAHRHTFQWIYERPELNFMKWLKSGSGVFWITGKPGSGKSTLMKSIYEDQRTIGNLPKDIENSIISCFFFHDKGTNLLLKSQEGLFRAILHSILSKYRQLIPIALPERYERLRRKVFSGQYYSGKTKFSIKELRNGFNSIINQSQMKLHLCLFIDGLDEFSGSDADIVKTLSEFIPTTTSAHVRIQLCLSSRPLREFEKAYSQHTHLKVQDLTADDIKLYVTSSFSEDAQLSDLLMNDPTTTNLIIDEILHKSEGVFLWVTLVVRSLIESLDNGDDMEILRRRLSVLPAGLVPLYKRMVEQIQEFYYKEAGKIFQMVHFAALPLSPLAISFAGDDPHDATTHEHTFSRLEISKRHLNVAKQLKARTLGLIEMSPAKKHEDHRPYDLKSNKESEVERSPWKPCQIQYMHLTVKEFLLNEKIPRWLAGSISTSAEGAAHLSIAACCLRQLRATRSPELYNYRTFMDYEFAGHRCHTIQSGIVYMIVFHTREAERATRTSKLSYLGSLDDFLMALPRKCDCASRGVTCHWSMHRYENWSEPDEWLSDFVSYLVTLGMTQSVVDVFRNHGYNPAAKAGRPLLMYATCKVAPLYAIPSLEEDLVQPVMVKELLKRGCNPNQSFNSPFYETVRDYGCRTVWESALLQIVTIPDFRSMMTDHGLCLRWLQVIELFLEYGAEPNLVTRVREAVATRKIVGWVSPLTIFNRVFADCDEPFVDLIRHFMVSKGAVEVDSSSIETPIIEVPSSVDSIAPGVSPESNSRSPLSLRREHAAQESGKYKDGRQYLNGVLAI